MFIDFHGLKVDEAVGFLKVSLFLSLFLSISLYQPPFLSLTLFL